MTQNEAGYLERRASKAIEMAEKATHPVAARAHYLMAAAYLARLYPEPGDERTGCGYAANVGLARN